MKKRLILSLLSAVLISANINYSSVDALTLPIRSVNSGYTITKPDAQITIDDVKKSLNISDGIEKEIVDTLQFQIKIDENWDNLKVDKDMDLYNSTGKSIGKPGDILIAVFDDDNTDINAITMGSITTHAAMVDSDPTKVLEVFPDGVQNRENDWRTRYKKILILRPKTNEETIKGAIEYGHTKINTPFNYDLFNKTTTDKFYCSQFVWRCYFNNGLDLDRNGGLAVFPYDFISHKTTIVYKQGE
ncbi:YiiX/YebB-like N1pC/P60 family cysteine hydrolase [Clostridium pasteurianum]|uniref:Cell wall-associated hydrolase-like protein n=1 Tax=Clostridium pasteurianum BC1 TaxID=86416 RepID=R4K134_CLOPA|nr:YiiX/YebB-like N1pC/P60 family cysteine hydrolase [Clostridium pasteurianum]AGK96278.1 cell wall-associated hydrolase-like protein [Clostridium pasteurianum BC1]